MEDNNVPTEILVPADSIMPETSAGGGLGFWAKLAIGAGAVVGAGAVGYGIYKGVSASREAKALREEFEKSVADNKARFEEASKTSDELKAKLEDYHKGTISAAELAAKVSELVNKNMASAQGLTQQPISSSESKTESKK